VRIIIGLFIGLQEQKIASQLVCLCRAMLGGAFVFPIVLRETPAIGRRESSTFKGRFNSNPRRCMKSTNLTNAASKRRVCVQLTQFLFQR
jgi:hypothetical protein